MSKQNRKAKPLRQPSKNPPPDSIATRLSGSEVQIVVTGKDKLTVIPLTAHVAKSIGLELIALADTVERQTAKSSFQS